MSLEDYRSALRLGQKEFRSCVSKGEYPYLQVLDDILQNEETQGEMSLGLVNIPMDQIVGTKTASRQSAFARNFMPLLDEKTEFFGKWNSLCDAQIKEGIRDPITAYEFMNRFYVAEGNKRVSVMKFFGAASIPGMVTRIIPKRRDTPESAIYFEFMDFYRLTKVNYIWFSQPGRFKALLKAMGTGEEPWDDKLCASFFYSYSIFRRAFDALGGGKQPITAGDALLAYLKLYSYHELHDSTESELRINLANNWKEITVQTSEKPVELSLDPKEVPPKSTSKAILDKLLGKPTPVKVAFVHIKTSDISRWTMSHETGRKQIEKALEGRINTTSYEGVSPETADRAIEEAVKAGSQVIFTTSPRFMPAALHAAAEHPEVKILNCSLNMPHPSIRTYYGRMYEAKFLSGVIAGALSESGNIGYIADYPIYGVTANINAFALGARMVNPRSQVYLDWSSLKGAENMQDKFRSLGADVISDQDLLSPRDPKKEFGLYRIKDGAAERVAFNTWNWGRFYELILRSIMDGGWNVPSPKAINYWWGLSSGVVDIRCAKTLPIGTVRLVSLLKESLISGAFRPFAGKLYSTEGVVQEEGELIPEQIVKMDWLAENVHGHIPSVSELTDEAREMVRFQGVLKSEREVQA